MQAGSRRRCQAFVKSPSRRSRRSILQLACYYVCSLLFVPHVRRTGRSLAKISGKSQTSRPVESNPPACVLEQSTRNDRQSMGHQGRTLYIPSPPTRSPAAKGAIGALSASMSELLGVKDLEILGVVSRYSIRGSNRSIACS